MNAPFAYDSERIEFPAIYYWRKFSLKEGIKRAAPAFTADLSSYGIEVKSMESPFFRFLINASRVHWNEEKKLHPDTPAWEEYLKINTFNIASPYLTPKQKSEQKQHLLNKIYAIGYLLDEKKDESRPWAVIAIDNTANFGGSGKSLFSSYIYQMIHGVHWFSGIDLKKGIAKFTFECLDTDTNLMVFDDVPKKFDFERLKDLISCGIVINKRGKEKLYIPFSKSPKILISTAYKIPECSSLQRRILPIYFSDWYRETHTPIDDFGFILLEEASQEQNEADINFLADCHAFYLAAPHRIDPPKPFLF